MDQDLKSFIQNRLKAGETISSVISSLKQAGWDDKHIDAVLRESFNQPNTSPSESKSERSGNKQLVDLHHLDATKTFVIIGSLLIIIAVIIVIAFQWTNVTPITRILFVDIPMFALFAIAVSLAANEKYHDVHEGTLATASVIFPFAIGTTLYQLKVIDEINPLLALISSLSAYILLILLEFVAQKRKFSFLTILYLYSFIVSLFLYFKVETSLILWILVFVSFLVMFFGLGLLYNKQTNGGSYFGAGVIATALILPSAILYSLNKETLLDMEVNVVILALFGLVYIGIALGTYQLYKQLGHRFLYDLKRVFEEVAPGVLLLPFIGLGFNQIGYMILAVALSFAYILVSIPIRISSLLPLGALGVIVGILAVTGKYFIDSLGWPVVVFLSGFAMIGISFLVRRVNQARSGQNAVFNTYGVGQDPALQKAAGHWGCGRILIVLILIFIILPWVASFFISFFLNRY